MSAPSVLWFRRDLRLDGAYIHRWVPELAHAEGVDVHAPWRAATAG